MSSKSIVDQIRHYQKDIERCPENSERMIRCIQRLYVLPILVQHLQETGVGRSVNSLRKFSGEVGEAAKALVTKWKAMVAAEESDDGDSATKETDAKQNPPNAHSNENGTKSPKDSNSSSKHDSSRHSSSHKRSHSSTTSESKADRKSSSSSNDKMDRKSSSERSDKHRHSLHDSKSREIKEEKGLKSLVNSKNGDKSTSLSHRSKDERRNKGEGSDHSPCRKKRKKNCVKERRKEPQESDDGSSGREDASQNKRSESPDRVLPDLSDEDSDNDVGGLSGNNSAQDSEDDEDEKSNSSDGESDPKSRKKSLSSEHHKSTSSSHSSSSSSKHKHSHHKEEKSDSKKSSSTSSKSSSKDLQKMIKENEKKIKKERFDKNNYDSSGSTPKESSSSTKNKEKPVKVEANDDGSIDAGSGFSFADALAGFNPSPKKKKKANRDEVVSPKPSSSSSSSHHKSSSSSSHSQKKASSSSLSSIKKEKHSDTLMPELLKRPIKLENLELDINSTLPEINPNYRPLPHIPEHSRRNSTKSATNEEEMFNMMMNKNQRTKVFSGGKSSYNTQVPTLYDLCIKVLYDHVDGLEYTGGVPYDLLKPLLEKLNPDQLFVLEHYNAYLIEDTGTLWEFHSKKDFRNKGRQEGETWRDLYIRCMEEREEKLKALTQNISQSIAASTPVRKAKLAYVDSAVKPPRNIARKQAKYGTGAGEASPIMKAHAAEKREILAKAIVGAHNPANIATTTVPAPPQSSAPRSWSNPAPISQKKRKAPLMAKALQLIKGTNRFKR